MKVACSDVMISDWADKVLHFTFLAKPGLDLTPRLSQEIFWWTLFQINLLRLDNLKFKLYLNTRENCIAVYT